MKKMQTGDSQNIKGDPQSINSARSRRRTSGKFLAVLLSVCLLFGVLPSALALDDGVIRDLNFDVSDETTNSLSMAWDGVQDAAIYEIHRSTSPNNYQFIATVPQGTQYYTDTNLNSDTTYYYLCVAKSDTGVELTSSMSSGKTLASIASITVGAKASDSGPHLTWTSVSNASEYYVLRSTTGSFNSATDRIATVAKNNYSPYYYDTNAVVGTTYYYTIEANVPSECNTVGITRQQLTLEVYDASVSTLSMYWNAINGSTHYLVFRSDTESGTYSQVGSTYRTTFTDTNLYPNTTYHYKVFAYENQTSGLSGYDNGTTLALPCTVIFDSNGGEPESITLSDVPAFSLIEAPAQTVTKDGYTFDGWYQEPECINTWDFTTDRVSTNTTHYLYAKWNKVFNTYTVTFNSTEADVAASPATLTITEPDSTVALFPRDPSRDGYKFLGWFTERADGERFTSSTQVTNNITVYAQWEKIVVPPVITPTDPKPPTPTNPETPSNPEMPGPNPQVPGTDPDPETDEPESMENEEAIEEEQASPSPTGSSRQSIAALESPSLSDSHAEQRQATLEQIVSDGVPTVTLGSMEVPLFGWGYEGVWALLNLILSFCGAICGAMLLVRLIKRSRKQTLGNESNEQSEKLQMHPASKGKTSIVWALTGIAASVVGVIVFFVTENFNSLMVVFTDNWTPLMIAIAIVVGVCTIATLRKKTPKALHNSTPATPQAQ